MAWYMPDFLFGNSKEPLLKVMESVLSSIFTPVVDFFKASFNSLYSNYPNLSMVGTGLVGLLGYITFNKFRTKKQAERVSVKEKNLDKIPGLVLAADDHKEQIRALDRNMLGVTTATLDGVRSNLTIWNKLNEIVDTLSGLVRTNDAHARKLDTISRATGDASIKLEALSSFGKKLDTIEGLQRTTNTTLEGIDAVVRPRSKTQ